jgi:hypothetical protein
MEACKNKQMHIDNCHQAMFRELDHLKEKIDEIQHPHQQYNSPKCSLQRAHHTSSVPTFRKITEVENKIVPGAVEYMYNNRHHLDDTQMK